MLNISIRMAAIKDGGIKMGYNTEIDELKTAMTQGKTWLVQLEAREKEETGRAYGGTISDLFCKDSQHPPADGIDFREKRSVYTGIYP